MHDIVDRRQPHVELSDNASKSCPCTSARRPLCRLMVQGSFRRRHDSSRYDDCAVEWCASAGTHSRASRERRGHMTDDSARSERSACGERRYSTVYGPLQHEQQAVLGSGQRHYHGLVVLREVPHSWNVRGLRLPICRMWKRLTSRGSHAVVVASCCCPVLLALSERCVLLDLSSFTPLCNSGTGGTLHRIGIDGPLKLR